MSQEAPKINFSAAQSRCVAIIRSNRGEIMCLVMCACVFHARQVIPRLPVEQRVGEPHRRSGLDLSFRGVPPPPQLTLRNVVVCHVSPPLDVHGSIGGALHARCTGCLNACGLACCWCGARQLGQHVLSARLTSRRAAFIAHCDGGRTSVWRQTETSLN